MHRSSRTKAEAPYPASQRSKSGKLERNKGIANIAHQVFEFNGVEACLSGNCKLWTTIHPVTSSNAASFSMAGASTAALVDFGASYWNPAIISALDDQEFMLGSALALPSIHMQSSLASDSVMGVFPPTNRSVRRAAIAASPQVWRPVSRSGPARTRRSR
jgi:hypothetical protein